METGFRRRVHGLCWVGEGEAIYACGDGPDEKEGEDGEEEREERRTRIEHVSIGAKQCLRYLV